MTSRYLIMVFFILAVWNGFDGRETNVRPDALLLSEPASGSVSDLAVQIEYRNRGNPSLQLPSTEMVITWEWSTFLGTEMDEWCYDMEVDPAGNVLLLGLGQPESYWYGENSGPPQAGEMYLFVAKLSADGELLWQTFLGEETVSFGYDMDVDADGYVYVAGNSFEIWGEPIEQGFRGDDAFVAKLDPDGGIIWNTFLGADLYDIGEVVAVDDAGNVYLGGILYVEWPNAPLDITEYTGYYDGFIAKYDRNGTLQWMTLLGAARELHAVSILVDAEANVYLAGDSEPTWATPASLQSGGDDGFLAKVDPTGELLWMDYFGSEGEDDLSKAVISPVGDVYIFGTSPAAWGDPLSPYAGEEDAYLVKFDGDGNRVWNTFVGSPGYDSGNSIAFGENGSLLLFGRSSTPWGEPVTALPEEGGFFIAEFSGEGQIQSHAFFEMEGDNYAFHFHPVGEGQYLVSGIGSTPIGTPLAPLLGGRDVLVAKIRLGEAGNALGFRQAGPYAPEISTYIPTPLDLSTDPAVIGTNLLLAALLMLPFAIATDLLTRTLADQEDRLKKKSFLREWLDQLRATMVKFLGGWWDWVKGFFDLLQLAGVVLFFGLVFSLLDPDWQPLSLKGVILFVTMTLAYGVVGIFDDFLQWVAIRIWKLRGKFNLRPSLMLLAAVSVGISRSIPLLPGLMFGTPEALQADETEFSVSQRRILMRISIFTHFVVGTTAWLPTIFTTLVQRSSLSQGIKDLAGGVEAFLLIVFAVVLENALAQLLGLTGGFGRTLKTKNRWLWLGSILLVGFLFLHTLLNPRYDFSQALAQGNAGLFIVVAVVFILATFGLVVILRIAKRSRGKHEPVCESTLAGKSVEAKTQPNASLLEQPAPPSEEIKESERSPATTPEEPARLARSKSEAVEGARKPPTTKPTMKKKPIAARKTAEKFLAQPVLESFGKIAMIRIEAGNVELMKQVYDEVVNCVFDQYRDVLAPVKDDNLVYVSGNPVTGEMIFSWRTKPVSQKQFDQFNTFVDLVCRKYNRG